MDTFFQDLRHALRRFGKAPGFTAVAVATLTLGIGATTALFSVVHGVLLRSLPYPDPQRIVRVFEVDENGGRNNVSDPNFVDLFEQNRSFGGLAKFSSGVMSVYGGDEAVRVVVAWVSRDFFRVMGVQPRRGRAFHAEEQREGAAPVAIVSEGFWRRHLEGDPELSGRTLRFGDSVATIVGVMPPGFGFPDGAEIWIPRELWGVTGSRTALNSQVVGRLAADVPLQRAGAARVDPMQGLREE